MENEQEKKKVSIKDVILSISAIALAVLFLIAMFRLDGKVSKKAKDKAMRTLASETFDSSLVVEEALISGIRAFSFCLFVQKPY